MRGALRVALGLLLAAVLVVPLTVARAHAELVTAEPAPGAMLTEVPPEVRLTFSEPVGPGSFIALYGEGFQMVPGVEARVDAARPEQLVAAIPELAPGVYTVQYSAASADSHQVAGSYTFSVAPEQPAFPALTGLIFGAAAAILVILGLVFLVLLRQPASRRHLHA